MEEEDVALDFERTSYRTEWEEMCVIWRWEEDLIYLYSHRISKDDDVDAGDVEGRTFAKSQIRKDLGYESEGTRGRRG